MMSNRERLPTAPATLNQEVLAEYGIETIAPAGEPWDKACLDGIDVHARPVPIIDKETGKPLTTSAPTPGLLEEFYRRRWTEEGYDVVHLSISAEMTVTPNIAKMAAEHYPNIYPVDSRNAPRMGILVLLACELRDQGMPAAEIARDHPPPCQGCAHRVCH